MKRERESQRERGWRREGEDSLGGKEREEENENENLNEAVPLKKADHQLCCKPAASMLQEDLYLKRF